MLRMNAFGVFQEPAAKRSLPGRRHARSERYSTVSRQRSHSLVHRQSGRAFTITLLIGYNAGPAETRIRKIELLPHTRGAVNADDRSRRDKNCQELVSRRCFMIRCVNDRAGAERFVQSIVEKLSRDMTTTVRGGSMNYSVRGWGH